MEFIVTQIDEIHDRDGGLVGYQCFDGTGQSVKVKKGQGGKLKDRWHELKVGTAYTFTMGSFTPPGKDTAYPYVQDFTAMSEALKIQPAIISEAERLGARVVSVTDPKSASIARAVAFKGAINLASHDKIAVADIGVYAKRFAPWLDTGD